MNQILAYLESVKSRRTPYEFFVVYEDYSIQHIPDIHKETFRPVREIAGVAIHLMDGTWKAYFLNPVTGDTLEQSDLWKPSIAIDLVIFIHNKLATERVLADARKVIEAKEPLFKKGDFHGRWSGNSDNG
jgi:hypothetical protein